MRVVLIYLGVGVAGFGKDRPIGDRESSWIGHGIASIGASLKSDGHDVELLDLRHLDGWDDVAAEIGKREADVFGLSVSPVDGHFAVPVSQMIRHFHPKARIIAGGIHPTIFSDSYECQTIDTVIMGEGEITFVNLLRDYEQGKEWPRKATGIKPDLDKLPWVDRELFDYKREMECFFAPGQALPSITMLAGRGCPYKCLSGETPIHTIEGIFQIQELVGRDDVKVLTRNPLTQMPMYANVSKIWKTRENADLVRVHFDDGSYIDCTPDHRFKVFKSKNQFIQEREWDVEAKDLMPKQQVRAVRFDTNRTGRMTISTRRDINVYHARIVVEATIGRSLGDEERIHHKNRNQGNDHPSNLELLDIHSHIREGHQEICIRMKENNPTTKMTPEWRAKISAAGKGVKRTLETRLKLRASKLGDKNPMYKESVGRRRSWGSRIPEVNHKVVCVEPLSHTADVYCMEVPGVEWFYANKVLVHNCTYCQPAENSVFGHPFRIRSAENVVSELKTLKDKYDFNSITFWDDTFTFKKSWVMEFCDLYEREKIGATIAACSRADIICRNEAMVERLAEIGLDWFVIGFESGSQRILDLIKKGTTVEQNIEAARICRKYGIKVFGTYMYGLPTETRAEAMATARMIDEIAPDHPSPFYFLPIEGTDIYNLCREKGLLCDETPSSITRTGMYSRSIKGVDYDCLDKIMQGYRS